MKKCFIAILILTCFLAASPAYAGLGDATDMVSESFVNFCTHLISLPIDALQLAASSGWTVVEVLIYPFRLVF